MKFAEDKKALNITIDTPFTFFLKVMRFAEETKSHIKDWSVDLGHGSRAGTKVVFIVKFIIITITVIMNITRILQQQNVCGLGASCEYCGLLCPWWTLRLCGKMLSS